MTIPALALVSNTLYAFNISEGCYDIQDCAGVAVPVPFFLFTVHYLPITSPIFFSAFSVFAE